MSRIKNEPALTSQITQLVTAAIGAVGVYFGLDANAAEALAGGFATNIATQMIALIPSKKNPLNVREKVNTDETLDREVDKAKREVRRENQFVAGEEAEELINDIISDFDEGGAL